MLHHGPLHELRRRPHPARGQQRQQHKRDLPYPRLSSPNEQCEQHTADGKRVLSGTPKMRAAQYKSQRGWGKAQNRTHDAHGRLLSSGIPHLIRCGMICRDRRHVSRPFPQALGFREPSSWTSTRSPRNIRSPELRLSRFVPNQNTPLGAPAPQSLPCLFNCHGFLPFLLKIFPIV